MGIPFKFTRYTQKNFWGAADGKMARYVTGKCELTFSDQLLVQNGRILSILDKPLVQYGQILVQIVLKVGLKQLNRIPPLEISIFSHWRPKNFLRKYNLVYEKSRRKYARSDSYFLHEQAIQAFMVIQRFTFKFFSIFKHNFPCL